MSEPVPLREVSPLAPLCCHRPMMRVVTATGSKYVCAACGALRRDGTHS